MRTLVTLLITCVQVTLIFPCVLPITCTSGDPFYLVRPLGARNHFVRTLGARIYLVRTLGDPFYSVRTGDPFISVRTPRIRAPQVTLFIWCVH